MGYYSKHTLSVTGEYLKSNEEWEQEISQMADYHYLFSESVKWYDREKDMIKFSKKYPEHIFMIERVGESDGDWQRHYYKNGEVQDVSPFISWPDVTF